MAKIYGTPIGGGGTGTNTTLPPLLDNFKAKAKGNISKKGHGEAVNIIDSIESELNGLKLYGKSTQDGTPTPETPIPIVSAGDNGTITVTVSDGAEQSQTLPVSTPNGLPGIPVTSGGNYTDADGQQWVCDEIDFERGKYVQRFKMLEFDGTEDWRRHTTNVSEYFRFCLTGTGIRNMKNNSEIIRGLSTHYEARSAVQTYTRSAGFSSSMYNENIGSPCLYIYDANHNTTVENWKSYLAAQKAAGTPVKVVYELETPVETNIPEETIEAYKSLTTYAPVTNIMTDSTPSAGIEIEYASTTMNVELSADKISENRGQNLLGAVWVYGDHEPESVNDGTKIELTREDVVQGGGERLNSLPSGSKVKLGIYNSKPLKWIVARDSVTQDLRLVLDKESVADIGQMMYDNAEPSNPDSDIQTKGNNLYRVSNIHQWLNSDKSANNWYSNQHEYDTPPDYAATKDGFLKEWSSSDKDMLMTINWPSPSYDSSTDSVNAKIALLSLPELNIKSHNTGNELDIFDDDESRAIGYEYWARTRNTVTTYYAGCISEEGMSNGGASKLTGIYVRAICAPTPNSFVSGPDDEGYYTIGGEATAQKTVQWNNEADFFARQFTYNSKKQYQTMLEGAIATLVLTGVPAPVSELAETHSGSSITLTWKNPTSDEFYDHTVVVYKTDAFPTAIDDGTQGYSGTDETATLSGLKLGTTYYIAVFTVSAYGLYGEPQTVQVEIPAGQLLSSLASGTKVKLGKWNNTDLQWKVARDTSDQKIRLVLEPTSVSLLGNKMYDNKEPSNSDTNRRNYGNNRYIYSNIHQWLNATEATSWYTAQHSTDAAPDYSSQAGFLSGWSENHIAALDRATLTTSRANVDGGGTETFVARVALISTTELGLQSNTGGGRLDIFNSDGDRATGSYYWTRTPNPSGSHVVRRVSATGTLSMHNNAYGAHGVRPLCSPKSTALVSLEMDVDNCYVVQ